MTEKTNTKPFYNLIIPSGWKVMRFDEILLDGKLGGNYENSESHDGVPVIKMGNLERGKMNIEKIQYLPQNENYNKEDVLTEDDLLFNTRNTLELVGKVAIWKNELPFAVYNSNLLRMKFKTDYVESTRFMNFAFNSHYALSQLRGIATGTTSVAAIYGRDLDSIKFLIPPLPEQKAIARLLSTWDDAINKNNLLIEKKLLQKKWLMQMLLTGKKRLKGFEDKWEEKNFGEVADIDKLSLGNQTPADYSFQYLSLSDVDTGTAQIKSERIIFKEAPSRARRIVSEGDVLLATVRPNLQGFLIVRDEVKNLIASTGFAVITCTKIHNEFLYQYLFTRKLMKQIEAVLTGSNYPAINSSDVKHLKIPYPSLEEQTAIANVLQIADKEIQLLKQKSEKLKEEKKGLMQVLLTGKKRLKLYNA
jgi:type I restriction enzyme S subunit